MHQNKIDLSLHENDEGVYRCSRCGHALFEARKKFDAGCGFPSFWQHKQDGIRLNALTTYGRNRTQLVCNACGQHIGHLFPNRLTPSGLRYCIAHDAIAYQHLDEDAG